MTYTRDETLRMLREIVAEVGPDTRYSDRDPNHGGGYGCRYRDDEGNPLCIVGTLMDKIDPSCLLVETGLIWDYDDNVLPAGMFDPDAYWLLAWTQKYQDRWDFQAQRSRYTWAEAVELAASR